MVNRHRGEIAAKFDGRDWTLCLTLGALAELEAAFEAEDLQALALRFSEGRLKADDLTQVITAGLRGAGHIVQLDDVRQMQAEGGALGFARVAGELLQVTFGSASEESGSQ